jgi:hypothetical protein
MPVTRRVLACRREKHVRREDHENKAYLNRGSVLGRDQKLLTCGDEV